jgi:hypothetical protein
VIGNLTLSSYLGEDIENSPFSMCRGGCNLELTADEIVSNETGAVFRFNSRATQTLVVGFPVLFPPYEKNVFVRMPVAGHKDATLVSIRPLFCHSSSSCRKSKWLSLD